MKKYLLVAACMISMIVSCTKTGPAGPIGPMGATGAQGPGGAQGPIGPLGTANVIYSDWFSPTTYTITNVNGAYWVYYDTAANAITQAILDSGTIITFGKLDGYPTAIWPTNQVAALPIVVTIAFFYTSISGSQVATSFTDTWSALATPGNLRILLVDSQNSYANSDLPGHHFRYVIIPGGVKTNRSVVPGTGSETGSTQVNSVNNARLHEIIKNYKQMSYSEICQSLGIPE